MTTVLIYKCSRQLFNKGQFKPFVSKYFKSFKYEGSEDGRYNHHLSISNWDDVKDILPTYAKPDKIL